jgi:hypothetical protein
MRELSINNMIEKEFVPFLTFESGDVLRDESMKIQRTILLHTAMLLGNCFKDKVTIVFKSQEGINSVKTTVWAATDNNVVLKGGTMLPVKSILDVKIF